MCNKLVKKSIWRAALLYTYALIGGCIFYVIERKPESSKQLYSRLAQQLQQNFTTQFNISINESDFKLFMEKAFEVVTARNKADWSIFTGLSFAMTSLTTVGYGNITPETPLGQIITVVYCLIGFPICILALKTLGEAIAKVIYNFIIVIEKRLLGRRRPRRLKTKSFCLTFMLMIVTLCIGGLTQRSLEGWSFVEGIYAWFATLSTIGYGDYIPGWNVLRKAAETSDIDTDVNVWLILSALALPGLAGLCVASGVINSLVDALEELKIQFKVRNKCLRCQRKKSMKLKELHHMDNLFSKDSSHNKVTVTILKERVRSATL